MLVQFKIFPLKIIPPPAKFLIESLKVGNFSFFYNLVQYDFFPTGRLLCVEHDVWCFCMNTRCSPYNSAVFALLFQLSLITYNRIARAFQVNSGVGFGCCIGAVDGILIKTKRPGKEECGVTGVKKFFCARKNSYGLNMQVVADSRRRILFYHISWPGSASD